MNKEEIIQQLEARGASKETIDKIKNATQEDALELAWKQLSWPERMWGRASWWIVWWIVALLVSLLAWLICQMNWIWIVAIIAALVVVWVLRSLWWRMIFATWIALIATHAKKQGDLLVNEINRLHAKGLKHDEILAE